MPRASLRSVADISKAQPLYRCFLYGEEGQVVGPPEIIDAADDDSAIEQGKKICQQKPSCRQVEVWLGAQRVVQLDRAA